MDQLTSGASNRIIPIFKTLRTSLIFLHTFFLSLLLLLWPRRRRSPAASTPPAQSSVKKRRLVWRMEEEDTQRRRALAEVIEMGENIGDGGFHGRWSTSLFYGVKRNALFCRSWLPESGELNYGIELFVQGISLDLEGNVHCFSILQGAFLEKIKSENPETPCFLFGHSTGGAVVLKAALSPHIEKMVKGIILTSPALRVKPAHPIVKALAPIFSIVIPKFQFKGANKRGIPVSRDPAALVAKYSDPLVYTGPIRVRTGHEILRISSYLMQNLQSVTVPFFVLHGTADKVTDPVASQDLYNEAASEFKDIKLYEGFLHDLLFEPEREEIGQDIINWLMKRLNANKTLAK
ncbi:uncharacterized protein LOC111786611 [Cucurbita pepo subsp. pepo]|uniref:uncharacterized protein LOC111786611 n=1 Tax=Cucurbita pepo subsp. pepo TaxID=3664 RepID=UPI000C9D7CF6|nr:uncharacterized protein LOC111786611 [Cucurbita pepo subsp. pepo]